MKYRKLNKYKYELMESLEVKFRDIEINLDNEFEDFLVVSHFIYLDPNRIYINKGYAWDGASGPAIDTKNFMIPSIVHDALYQLIKYELLDISERKKADQILKELCLRCGMSKFRATYVYLSVRMFGGLTLKKKLKKKKIYEVFLLKKEIK